MTIGPGRPASLQHMPNVTLSYESFTVERYSDGSPANDEAQLQITGSNWPLTQGTVRINEPLARDGLSVYLTGYEGSGDEVSLSLLAVHDPGYGPVVAAGLLLLLGLTVSFYFPHRWIVARVEPDGGLRLAGQAGRWGGNFGIEFTALLEELRRVAPRSN